MKPRDLWILQYDLTNCTLATDADAGAAEAELLAGSGAVEDREFAEHARAGRARIAAGRRDHRLDRGRGEQFFRDARAPRDRQEDDECHDHCDRARCRERMQHPERKLTDGAIDVVTE